MVLMCRSLWLATKPVAGNGIDYYNTDATAVLAACTSDKWIVRIDVYTRVHQPVSAGVNWVKGGLRLNGTTVWSANAHAPAAATDYYETITRPGGGVWTVDDLVDLQVGVQIQSDGGAGLAQCNESGFVVMFNDGTVVSATGIASGEIEVKTMMVDNTGEGWLANWDNRIRINIDHTKVDANLTHFPLLIKLCSSAGTDSDDVTVIFDELGANYLKLAITKDDGTTEMYVEVEKWDSGTEEAWLWTSLDGWTIDSATDTTIYIYYDNDHADNNARVGISNDAVVHNVWDVNYILVDHMQDGADNASTYDSTSNNNDGIKKGAGEPAEVAGKVGKAQDFDAIDDEITRVLANEPTTQVTVEVIAKLNQLKNWSVFQKHDNWATVGKNSWSLFANSNNFIFGISEGTTQYNGAEYAGTIGEDVYLAGTYGGLTTRLYTQGVFRNSDAKAGLTFTPLATYYTGDSSNSPDSVIDEVRISNISRTDAWILATKYTYWDDIIDYIPDANGNLNEFAYDFSIAIDGVEKDRTPGVSVPDNANDWVFMSGNATPYAEYYKHEVDGVLITRYEPNDMIIGTTLPDREAAGNDAVITWGSNPAGVSVDIGSMSSSGTPAIGGGLEQPVVDYLPAGAGSDLFVEPDVGGTLLTNPIRPLVTLLSDTTTLTELQAWRIYGLAFVLFIAVATGRAIKEHLLICGIATGAAIGSLVALTIWPLWTLSFIVLAVFAGIKAERTPSL